MSAVVNFFIRAAIGMALIFFINQYVIPPDSSINVGMNAVSFLTSGTLGIPGVGLLYGIVCYQILRAFYKNWRIGILLWTNQDPPFTMRLTQQGSPAGHRLLRELMCQN